MFQIILNRSSWIKSIVFSALILSSLAPRYLQAQNLLENYHILFVRGVFTDAYTRYGRAIRPVVPRTDVESFRVQKTWLKKHNFSFSDLKFSREALPDEVTEALAKEILKQTKPVLLITHSKGGLDVLHTLVAYPHVIKHLAGWISLQTPFYGGVFVDALVNNTWVNTQTALLRLFLKPNMRVLKAMTTKVRQEFIQKHRDEIRQMTQKLPILSVGSWIQEKGEGSMFDAFVSYINKNEGPNDGLVSVESACLAGTHCLSLEGVDHSNLVLSASPFKNLPAKGRMNYFFRLIELWAELRH